jgi:hypothetical protein
VREGKRKMIQFLTSDFACKGSGGEKMKFCKLVLVLVFSVRNEREGGESFLTCSLLLVLSYL